LIRSRTARPTCRSRWCGSNSGLRRPELFLHEDDMTTTSPEQNKALVLEAFDTLFNKRDYVCGALLVGPLYPA
jgi:hypothetical protein